MPLTQEQKNIRPGEREGVFETAKNIEKESGRITEEVKEVVEQRIAEKAVPAKALPSFEKPNDIQRPEALRSDLEGKSESELESILASKIADTAITEMENNSVIKAVIEQFANSLTEKDLSDEKTAQKISDIADKSSNGEVGTYAWLEEKIKNSVDEIKKIQPMI